MLSKKESRIECAMAGGLLLAMMLSILMAFGGECREISGQVLRLHVLANSDSPADQALKLDVRDAVLETSGELFKGAVDLSEAENAAAENLEIIRQAAEQEVRRQGYTYKVGAQLVNMYFETRTYDNATLPAGRYDAVRITIGSAQGHNWWCVMFPPMCVEAAAESQPELTARIESLGKRPDYKMAFAGVELVENLLEKLRGGDSEPQA